MQSWWIAAVGPVLAGLSYCVRRAIEGSQRGERLNRRLQALALLTGLKRSGLTFDELDRLSDEQ